MWAIGFLGLTLVSGSRERISFSLSANETQDLAGSRKPSSVYFEKCHKFRDCYCMRYSILEMNNLCGWCEATKKTLVGTPMGPVVQEGSCDHWVWKSEACPTLYCGEDITALQIFLYSLPTLVMSCLLLCWKFLRGHPPGRLLEDPQLTEVVRTKEDFRKGLWGRRSKTSKRDYQLIAEWDLKEGTSTQAFWKLAAKLLHSTTVFNSLSGILSFGLVASVIFTLVRVSPLFLQKRHFETILLMSRQMRSSASTLHIVVGLLFGFYALGRVSWWWSLLDCGRTIQGRVHDVALLIGGTMAVTEHKDLEAWWQAKWNVFRYLMLIFYFNFRVISPIFAKISYEELEKLGLVEAGEVDILRKAYNPRRLVTKWLTAWVEMHVEDHTVRTRLLDKLCSLRGACASLHDQMEKRAPWTFEGVLYSTVYLYVVFMPLQHVAVSGVRTVIVDTPVLLPVFNCTLIAGFYFTMLNLLHAFKDPYGPHTDSLHVPAIFLESETEVWETLTGPLPPCMSSNATEQLYFEKS